jgi:N-acyl-L-homoserine lactone synthetase
MRTANAATIQLSTDLDPVPSGLLDGFRFRMCDTAESFARALEVRRQVYVRNIGYQIPVPDTYDTRSWLLVAEHTASGRVVGTLRLTPRFGGTFELEEYFALPAQLRSPRAVELSRFAILPEYRKGSTFIPVVSFGLFLLVRSWLDRIGAHLMVICAKPENVWTYEWLRFQRTGLTAPYGKLGNVKHEVLYCDIRLWCDAHGGVAFEDHPFKDFAAAAHPEIELPTEMPRLDLVSDLRRPLADVA